MTCSQIFLQLLFAHFFADVKSNICSCGHEDDNRTVASLEFNTIKLVTTHLQNNLTPSQIIPKKISRMLRERQSSADQAYRRIMLESLNIRTNKTCNNNLSQPAWETRNTEERPLAEREWTKNYASEECGAKLIRASESMKNPSHLINRNEDEYMLFQCGEASYFVLELCETIKVIRFELDNKELYSGTTRNFTVRTGDKFSTDPNDWTLIGGFEASSHKMETQNFAGLKVKTFGKFIRVDISSFHGNEHFCTLTSFRVFGLTEYDYLSMNEEDHDDHNESYLTITENNSQSQTYSSRMIRVEMKDEMTIYSYEYVFLQTRQDVCLGNSHENREVGSTNLVTTDSSKGMKKEKDSVLVGLSNKVKILEKNLTVQSFTLKHLENSQAQQAKDLNKLYKITLKTDESLGTFSRDSENVQSKVMTHDKKISYLEKEMSRFEDSLFIATGVCVCLAMICNFLILYICCVSVYRKKTAESAKETDFTKSRNVRDSQVQTDVTTSIPAPVAKKVSFSDDNNNDNLKTRDEDISMKLNVRRIVKRDPSRRVTWCPGTFQKLALEAQQLIREI